MALVVKNLPASAGDIRDKGLIPGREDPLEKGMAVHSSVLAWRIPWTEEPGGLQSMGLQRDWSDLVHMHPQGGGVSPGFLQHSLVGIQAPHCSLKRRQVKSLWRGGGRATVFPVMFALSRATVLFISYLSWEAAPFLVLWLKSRLLLGLFFFFPESLGISGLPWHVWVTWAPSLPYIRQKENSGNSLLFFFSWFQVPPRMPSLHLRVILHLLYIWYPEILVVVRMKNSERFICSIFLKISL